MSENEPSLESLRAAGVHQYDPVRFRYLEVLAGRLPAQPPAVRQVLAGRLQAALADYATRARDAVPVPSPATARAGVPSALAALNRDLAARTRADADADAGADADAEALLLQGGASASELQSVRRFGEVWAQIAAEQQVAQAITRGPENAGPLNAHRLVLRSLALMQSLSPDYLRHFLLQMDSLLWLERAVAKPARAPLRPARAARSARP